MNSGVNIHKRKIFRTIRSNQLKESIAVSSHSQPTINYTHKVRPRWQRFTAALWHDSRALWREFQRPIIIFFLVTFGGGFLYGELHIFAGYDFAIPLIDRPYVMLQLMILETPAGYDHLPDEWFLIMFWYALPPTLLFIIGDGVADFVRLFFDREGRGDAWMQALASTYRHHVIVMGAGHVGMRVIRTLYEMGVEVVVIDGSPDLGVQDYLSERRIPLIQEDGRLSSTLQKAGLMHADAFVACTGNDHVNLETIMRTRAMNKEIRIVARVWDDQFAAQMQEFMNVQHVLSSSDLAAPAFAGLALGVDITQSIHVAGRDYSTVRLEINDGSFMAGKTVGDLQTDYDMDIVLMVERGQGAEVQPAREKIVRPGDILVIFAHHERSLEIAARNRYRR